MALLKFLKNVVSGKLTEKFLNDEWGPRNPFKFPAKSSNNGPSLSFFFNQRHLWELSPTYNAKTKSSGFFYYHPRAPHPPIAKWACAIQLPTSYTSFLKSSSTQTLSPSFAKIIFSNRQKLRKKKIFCFVWKISYILDKLKNNQKNWT